MNRYKLFDTPHKALRLALSDLLTLAGKTDFTIAADIELLQQNMKVVFSLIHSHSSHEDDICFVALDKIAPDATTHDRTEHQRLHLLLNTFLQQIEGILIYRNKGLDVSVPGDSFYASLCLLHAEMLIHMIEEERDTQPVFWNYMTDEELQSFQPQILAAMTPEESDLWLQYIFASHTENEVAGMIKGISEKVSQNKYEHVLGIAKKSISMSSLV